MPTSFEAFLESVKDRLGEDLYARVHEQYAALLENCAPMPLRVPESMRMNALTLGYSDKLNIIPATGSVDGNDASKQYPAPNNPMPSMQDQSGEVDPKTWEHPKFKQPTHLTSIPIRKMIERAQSHINRPIEMTNADQIAAKRMSPLAGRDGANVPVSTDAGYAGGSGGASASAGGGE